MNDKQSDAAEGEIITLSQAGKILNASYATVRRLVVAGELKGFRLRNSWRTSTTACEEYIKRQFDEQAVICRSTDER
ncbi:MAG: excisionase family DNA-binding protein [Collinsella sp.]|jgi:excisionase family DNA binding protein|nr:excisionase family DNA-binding protein [Collinsella sp.]MDY5551353.1 excisionase family DNA-binding protein [Collinsella sp.]